MNRTLQSLQVYPADALRVISGAQQGDALGWADEMVPDDVYNLSALATLRPLRLHTAAAPPFRIADDSALGRPGHLVHLDCCVTFMTGRGETTEALVLVETGTDGTAHQTYGLPLAPMSPKTDYVLVGVSRETALQRYAEIACTSFTSGTLITMATGAQVPVEALAPGDRVLTRDSGPQAIRWIGHRTLRAIGAFAPIRIRAGVLNNSGDLMVAPDHRLLVYQRRDELGAGRAEVLVRARHLVNGDTVIVAEGGFVDYYQMLFDDHQIIYAEGIAAESMLVDDRTAPTLPADLADRLTELMPGHRRSDIGDLEVGEALLARPDAAELLRKSSGN